ncbi:MAG: hypothetical protein GC146_04895 [Limimaricola sp.]|uniref:DUF6524 family protein n=1 Tax=Limimaricola sp. TaxID=2211665 RepID=UPI001DB3B98A|nr:DUF6524 family protein [Limimaricola sp.]MBI1416543.1 hypothetical protein [Limimaricola sp.]
MGFVWRWIFAFALLAVTYNPTQVNYIRWAQAQYQAQLPLVALAGLLLLVGYIVYLRATVRSIGIFGVLLTMAVIGTAVWVLYDRGVISLSDPTANTWIALFALSVVLAIGLSWSIVRRKLSGQLDVDDHDDT